MGGRSHYEDDVMGLIKRSIADFSLQVGGDRQHSGYSLPDLWVDGTTLYQSGTPDDGEGQRYKLTYRKILDPYCYSQDEPYVIMSVVL
jgi:hypothetical protein